jgi:hypothetical protein
MPSIDKKYYHNLDLDSNEIKAGRIYNLTTTQRNALSLATTDKGYLVYDTTLLSLFVWNGTAWTSAGGGSQNLQQVTTAGNTTTNNIILNSTTGEYPNNGVSQNTITDNSIYIDYSDTINNAITDLQPSVLQLTSFFATYDFTSTYLTSGGLNLIAFDPNILSNNGGAQLYASDGIGSSYLGLSNASNKFGRFKVTNLTNNVILQFPNKTTGSYTIATTADIPTNTSVGFEQNFLLMGA